MIGITVNLRFKSNRDKLSGILRYAATKPHWTIAILDDAKSKNVVLDALISIYGVPNDPLRSRDIPTVAVDWDPSLPPRGGNLHVDNRLIGKTAAELFIRRGFASLAAVRHLIEKERHHSSERADAFVAAAAKHGLDPAVYTPGSAGECRLLCCSESFREWLLELPKPCGIFCYCDRQARDVLDCCRLAQLSVPDQVSILGVDNETDVCEVSRPTLSSIQPDFEAAGYRAAEVLDRLLSHRKVRPVHTYGILQVVERESTRSLRAGGRIVSAAMRLIQTADAMPTVTGLARRLHVSTTFLNRRFREILGHGPKEEIDRWFLARVKTLLRNPGLSVAEVADLCHFAYPEELHRFFRRHTGLTPSQWRKR